MSADNGIYILVTPASYDEYVREYRVIHCQNIEDIYWDAEKRRHVEDIQPMMLKEKFNNAPVSPSPSPARSDAFKMARDIAEEGLPLEYGIREIHYDKPFPK